MRTIQGGSRIIAYRRDWNTPGKFCPGYRNLAHGRCKTPACHDASERKQAAGNDSYSVTPQFPCALALGAIDFAEYAVKRFATLPVALVSTLSVPVRCLHSDSLPIRGRDCSTVPEELTYCTPRWRRNEQWCNESRGSQLIGRQSD